MKLNEIRIWSQDGPEEEIEIRCVKAVEKFWKQGVKQLEIEISAFNSDDGFRFALAALYNDPSATRSLARHLLEEAFPKMYYCDMSFYNETITDKLEPPLERQEFEEELQENLRWAERKTLEKLPSKLREKIAKGKELIVTLNTYIICYAEDHDVRYILDAYNTHYQASAMTSFLENKANRLGKLIGFRPEKRTDIKILNVDDEEDGIYATVQIKSRRELEEDQARKQTSSQ